jgi:hypothetical protein
LQQPNNIHQLFKNELRITTPLLLLTTSPSLLAVPVVSTNVFEKDSTGVINHHHMRQLSSPPLQREQPYLHYI